MLQAVIFDLDGTIANTIPAIREGVNLTMELYGYPTHTDEDILRFINNGAKELIRRAMPTELQQNEEQVLRVLADYDRLYGGVYQHTNRCYDGIPAVIRRLHDELGLKIAVLSNKQDQFVKSLAANLIPDELCAVAQGVIAGRAAKPDPYLSQLVADALAVPLCDCVMVGDSDVDIRTAQNAGMKHIGVSWGYRDEAFLREKGANLVANTPAQLFDLIAHLKHSPAQP